MRCWLRRAEVALGRLAVEGDDNCLPRLTTPFNLLYTKTRNKERLKHTASNFISCLTLLLLREEREKERVRALCRFPLWALLLGAFELVAGRADCALGESRRKAGASFPLLRLPERFFDGKCITSLREAKILTRNWQRKRKCSRAECL